MCIWLTVDLGSTNGGMGQHIDNINYAEMVVFGKVCLSLP